MSGSPFRSSWRELFPYDSPYDVQEDAIQKVVDAGEKDGFVACEAACGSGKTLIALTAGLELVRNPKTQYEQVLCVTSVKQQLRAFEDDLEAINANLAEDIYPVSAMTLVGKGDLCSYTETGHIDPEEIYRECEDLRDPIKNAISSLDGYEKYERLQEFSRGARVEVEATTGNRASQIGTPLQTEDWSSPYQPAIAERDETSYCPFYADFRRQKMEQEPGESLLDIDGLSRRSDILSDASNRGVCPHAAMQDALNSVEVLIANYYHIFDPQTVGQMTSSLLCEETFLICDEAHMLVPKTRELLSDRLSPHRVDLAVNELEDLLEEGEMGGVGRDIWNLLENANISEEDIEAFAAALEDLRDHIRERASDRFIFEFGNDIPHFPDLPSELDEGLRDPKHPAPDEISEWIVAQDYEEIFESAQSLGGKIAAIRKSIANIHRSYVVNETYADGVGRVLSRWLELDHVQYFRSLKLEKRTHPDEDADARWAQSYNTRLELLNCIPRDPIARRLDQFGGGILMSATLAPLGEFEREVGLQELTRDKERLVRRLVYGLEFPERNRASCILPLDRFTYRNRGLYDAHDPPDTTTFNPVRQQYAEAIRSVAGQTPGNVLVAMPSYHEAIWAKECLEEARPEVNKDILLDESSSNAATEELKQTFFSGDAKVLVTSLRGTLTEGVDYKGDRLKACIVCGVPIQSLRGDYPDAIRTAYEDAFGSKGFEIAFTVPAVRKARQAVGRVIRGEDETGVRILADRRYVTTARNGVRNLLPDYEQSEFERCEAHRLPGKLTGFWQWV